jgi:hypothetical protein
MPVSGRTLPSKIRLATTHDVSPEMELQLDVPARIGQRVRVTVYDEGLFRKGKFAQDYQRVFSVFVGTGPQVVPNLVREPGALIGDGSNGILLTFQAEVVDEVPKRAERKHKKWAFGAPTNIVTCSPKQALVDVAFGTRDQNNERAFGPVVRLPRDPTLDIRRLVVVVSLDDTSEVLYSNTWRTPDLVQFNGQAGPTLLHSRAVEAEIPATVGGQGFGTGAPAPAGRIAADTDLSGMYEAFTSASQEIGTALPVLMVQLCTAGNSVAGWFAPPPSPITTHPQHRLAFAAPPGPIQRGEFGILLGHFVGTEFDIHWGHSDSSQDPRPDLVGANRFDPDPAAGTGKIRVLAAERLELTLTLGAKTAQLFLSLADPTPRWSNRTRDEVVRRAAEDSNEVLVRLRTHQQQPIPLGFWRVLQNDFVATGALGVLIVQHQTISGDPQTQRGVREAIGRYLAGLVAIPEHAEAVLAHFTLLACNIDITIDGQTKSTYDWLRRIADDFTSNLVSQGVGLELAVERLPSGFIDTGVVPPVGFAYSLSFLPLGAGVSVGPVGVGAYVFDVEVTRKVVKNDIETDPIPPDAWTLEGKKVLFGGFGDLSLGLGAQLKFGGSSNLVRDVTFRSFHNVVPARFNQATFYTISASALSVSALLLSAKLADSAVMVMTVNSVDSAGQVTNSVRMVAGVDRFLVPPDPSRPTPQLVKKFNPFSIMLFSMTLGYGWMQEKRPAPDRVPDPSTPPNDTLGTAEYNVQVFYRRNSATLEGTNLSALEEAVAVERALFVSGGGRAFAAGHASPEGPDNDGLSQRRADNLIKVLTEALAGDLAVSTGSFGYGHRAALNDGLTRPETVDPNDKATLAQVRSEEQRLFPQYRTVMLWVNGLLLIQVQIGKGVFAAP